MLPSLVWPLMSGTLRRARRYNASESLSGVSAEANEVDSVDGVHGGIDADLQVLG